MVLKKYGVTSHASLHNTEAKSVYLGPLIVTPEMVAKNIKAMKDNKSPGVDGIPPKLLMETVKKSVYHLQEYSTCH